MEIATLEGYDQKVRAEFYDNIDGRPGVNSLPHSRFYGMFDFGETKLV